MGCQKDIASGIIDKEADYVLALKGNQSSLQEDVLLFFEEQQGNSWKGCQYDYHEETDAGHGRIEIRKCWAVSDIAWLTGTHDWKGLQSIALIEAKRIIKDKESIEQRLYISSLPANAQTIAQSVRAHWSIENNLHWVMDVVFNDDRNQTKNRQAAFNLQTIKKMTLNLLKKHKSKKSISIRRKGAGWNFNLMLEILNAAQN